MFFFSYAAPTAPIYTLSLHDALPICHLAAALAHAAGVALRGSFCVCFARQRSLHDRARRRRIARQYALRSEEHTSELQSRQYLVCRLLLEKKKPREMHRQTVRSRGFR